jgi:hypothetical protein
MKDEQPHVDRWPLNEEALSKISAPFDIEAARLKLARKFNTSFRFRPEKDGPGTSRRPKQTTP